MKRINIGIIIITISSFVLGMVWAHLLIPSSNVKQELPLSVPHYEIIGNEVPQEIILKAGKSTTLSFIINSTEPAIFWVGVIDGELAEKDFDRVLFDSWAYYYHPEVYYKRLELWINKTGIDKMDVNFLFKNISVKILDGKPIELSFNGKMLRPENIKEVYVNGLKRTDIIISAGEGIAKGNYRLAIVVESPEPGKTDEWSTEGWSETIFIDLKVG